MLKQLFARHVAGRGLINSRRQRAGTRYRMLGETLERRSMFAVSASLSAGTLNIALSAAGDAAFLSYNGSSYAVTDSTGAAVSGSPFTGTGVTAAVSVTGTVDANQSFTFNGSTSLPVSLSVASSMESATISQTIAATSLSGSTVSLSSAAITLAADISTAGAQTYAGAVLLVGSPSITSTGGAVSFQSTVDTYFGVAMAPQTTFATGTNPFSVATGDLNGDGKPDLAIANANSNSVSVLLNTTAPGATTPSYAAQATFATGTSPRSVAIGDLNGDGKPDLAVANAGSNSASVLLSTTAPGATTPTYAAQTTFATGGTGSGKGPRSVAIGDLNGDGKPDLAIANYSSDRVCVRLNTTTPGATTPSYASAIVFATGFSPISVSIGDLNGDGKPDLAIANRSSNSVSVLLNTMAPGATTPTYAAQTTFATGTGPFSVSIGDLNGDGKPDLAVANAGSNSASVFLNTTAPGATTPSYAAQATFATGDSPLSVAIGDFNGDGRPDLAIANNYYSNSVSVLLSTTAPGATTPSYAPQATFATGTGSFSVAIGDFNGDGKPDLAVANAGSDSVSVLMNTTLVGPPVVAISPQATFATGANPVSVATGDLNGDGRPDLAIANDSNSVSVLLSTTAPGATAPSYAAQTTFATGNNPRSISIGDLNGDGRPDLAIANNGSKSVSLLLNTTAPGATAPSYASQTTFATGTSPISVSISDLNGDGRPDLAIINLGPDSVSVLLNTTAPGATAPSYAAQTTFATGFNPFSVSIGDLNGDGKPDLAIANFRSDSVSVLLNTTAPGATAPSYAAQATFATRQNPISVSIGDLNGDGRPDLAITNYYSRSVSVLLNTTTPGATAPSYAAQTTFATGTNPRSVSIGDLNGDGKPDLAIANYYSNSASVLLNTTAPGATAPSYAAQATFATGTRPFSVSIGDLNGDGKPDLAIANFRSNSVSVLLNATTSGNLTVSSATGTTFAAAVGGTTPLTSVTIASGPTSIGGNVTTTGSQTYTGAVTLTADTTLSGSAASGVALAFKGTVDGAKNFAVSGGTGTIAFDQAVGGTTALASLQVLSGTGLTAAGPLKLDGSAAGARTNGLEISAGVNNVSMQAAGSSIKNYSSSGLVLKGTQNSTISGFTVSGNNSKAMQLAAGDYTGTKIVGNTITGGSAMTYGIFLSSAQNLQVGGTSIGQGNTVTNTSYGLYATGSLTGTTVAGNTISSNDLGIWLSAATSLTVNGANQLTSNKNFGLYANGTNTGTVFQGNTVAGSSTTTYGVFLTGAQSLQVGGTSIGQGNTVTNTSYGLYATGSLTGTTVAGNTISGNDLGVWLSAATSLTVNGANQLHGNKNFGLYADGTNTGTVFQGNTINGSSTTTYGVFLTGAQSLQVGGTGGGQGNTITDTGYGLHATGALTGTTVAGNTISSSGLGIWLSAATSLTVNGANQLTGNKNFGLYATGTNTGTVFQGNTVNGSSTTVFGVFLTGAQSLQVGGTSIGQGNTITATGYGIYAGGTLTGTTVAGNTVSANGTGMWMSGAQGVTVNGGNQFTNNTNYGLYATSTTRGTPSTFQGNTINGGSTTKYGLLLTGAQDLQVGGAVSGQGNTITATGYGLYAGGTLTGTTVVGNTISSNGTGIWLSAAQSLTINGANQLTTNTTYGLYATGVNTGTVFQGNTVNGNSTTTYGVFLSGAQSIQVGGTGGGQGNTITNAGYGLYASGTLTGTTVAANTLSTNGTGIWLNAATGLTINGANQLTKNTTFGFYATGVNTNTVFQGNTVDGSSTTTYGVFLTGAQGLRVGGTVTGQDNTITNTSYGLYAAGTLTGTTVAANTIQSNNNGLWLDGALGITINNTNRVITNRSFGLFAKGVSTGTTVTGNTISGNGTNISTAGASGGTFQTS